MKIQPSLIWAMDFAGGQPVACPATPLGLHPSVGEFRWLHLDLVDQVTRSWIAEDSGLPEPMQALLLGSEQHQRSEVADGYMGCVLHDVERDFDRLDTERTGVLRIVLGPDVMISARHAPVRSADIVRRHIERDGAVVRDSADALNLLISSIVENVAAVARDQGRVVEMLEDDLLDEVRAFDQRRLIQFRRRIVQFHRLLGGMRAVFERLDEDDDLPDLLRPTVEKLAQQLAAVDGEMLSYQSQLRLLREEADLQATQRTNENLYLLSVLSALLLPATLVTGFFGMNTGGLPFAHGDYGTLAAGGIAILSSALTFLALRLLTLNSKG